jgi:cation diffusion facilitator family transporter
MGRDPRKTAMLLSLLVSVLMLAGKLSAYFITHSAAILADAAESVVHGAATGFAAFSLWYARQPADADHPYGHGRIAYFSAGFEGALVLAASIAVLWSGVRGLLYGVTLDHLGVGLAIAGGLAAINLALGITLIRVGRRTQTLILVSNGRHVLSDVLTTAAAIVGVGLVMVTEMAWLDPLAALLIGVVIMVSGLGLIRTSYQGLMDRVDPGLTTELVDGLREQVERGVIVDFHQLRCRRTDDQVWIDVHVLIPGELSMRAAHDRVTELEDALRRRFPREQLRITSHLEPADHDAAHPEGHVDALGPLG